MAGQMTGRRVWKLELDEPVTETELPVGSTLVHVGSQHGKPCVWYEVDPEEERTARIVLSIVATGQPLPEFGVHAGTVVMGAGSLVWHIYMQEYRELEAGMSNGKPGTHEEAVAAAGEEAMSRPAGLFKLGAFLPEGVVLDEPQVAVGLSPDGEETPETVFDVWHMPVDSARALAEAILAFTDDPPPPISETVDAEVEALMGETAEDQKRPWKAGESPRA